MKRKIFKTKNNFGFTMVEVMIATVLLIGAGYSVMSLLRNTYTVQKGANAVEDVRTLNVDMANLLANPAACLKTFAGNDPTVGFTKNEVLNGAGAVIYAVGNTYGTRTVKLTAINVGGAGADARTNLPRYTATNATSGIALVLANWTKVGETTGPGDLHRFFKMNVTLDGTNKIIGCTAIPSSAGGSVGASMGAGTDGRIVRWGAANSLVDSALVENNNNIGLGGSPASLGDGGSPRILQITNSGANAYGNITLSTDSTAAGNVAGSISFGTTGTNGGDKRTASIVSSMTGASGTNPVGNLGFYTNNGGAAAERMRIEANGNVSVGTPGPAAAKLDVAGEVKVGNTTVACNGGTMGLIRYNAAAKAVEFCDGASWKSTTSCAGPPPPQLANCAPTADCPAGVFGSSCATGRDCAYTGGYATKTYYMCINGTWTVVANDTTVCPDNSNQGGGGAF